MSRRQMSATPPVIRAQPPLEGAERLIGALALSAGTFMTILDTSVTNVSIPTISGDLGISPTQGAWIITSYSVAVGIALPLTGWLTARFGQVRLFLASVMLFTATSLLCGLAASIESMVALRVLQGVVAGPMVPLSQSLLLASFPREKAGLALALWSMTALAAPVSGPLLGGWISEEISWPWIFYLNVPIGIVVAVLTWRIYRGRESPTRRVPVDIVGLALLVVWVGALQIMLDKGKDLDWFASGEIVALACAAAAGFALFLAWELLDNRHPVVDLPLFAIRNFWTGTAAQSLGYAIFFGTMVVMSLWLQTVMGYTPTWAGLMTAPVGLLSILIAPFLGRGVQERDPRPTVTFAFLIFAGVSFARAGFDLEVDAWTIVLWTFIQGAASVMFFMPLTALLLSGIPPERIPAAAGLSNFVRYSAGAFGASVAITVWDERTALHRAHLVEQVTSYDPATAAALEAMQARGFSPGQALALLEQSIDAQARMMGTNDLFWLSGVLFLALAVLVWIARPVRGGAAAGMATSKRGVTA
jgi:DHA2 family multidrug resistance protein